MARPTAFPVLWSRKAPPGIDGGSPSAVPSHSWLLPSRANFGSQVWDVGQGATEVGLQPIWGVWRSLDGDVGQQPGIPRMDSSGQLGEDASNT
mmetsp:Transcript_115460/g.236086  ORF Transcript_115460/g.236086 Transcript_115460/m.236086 type:complete len:93 (+) Transcript_115460:169-447(+)